jgi:hypothetical protein
MYRKAETCEAKANECISDLAASGMTNKSVPALEAIQSCRESQSYFCRVFSPANAPNILLVLVGFAGIVAAFGTLRILERQTDAAKDTAQAALLSAEAVIKSERAWVDAGIVPNVQVGVLRYGLEIRNHGKTPAQLVSYQLNYDRVDPNGTWSLETLKGFQHRRLEFFLGTEKPFESNEFDIKRLFSDLLDHKDVLVGIIFLTVHYNNVVGMEKNRECSTVHGYKYDILTGNLERIPIFTKYT